MQANIFKIKRNELADGSGLRTTIYFKGCPLRCVWCSTPHAHERPTRILWDSKHCLYCNLCVSECPTGSLAFSDNRLTFTPDTCTFCRACTDHCPSRMLHFVGQMMNMDEIMEKILADRELYGNGGVILSGGDPLMQPEAATAVLKKCKEHGIRTAIETTAFAKPLAFSRFIANADMIIIDLKHYSEKKYVQFTGVSNHSILENLDFAISIGKKVAVRITITPGINDTLADAKRLAGLMNKRRARVNLMRWNPVDGIALDRTGDRSLGLFREVLDRAGVPVVVRDTQGRDISAACGQLWLRDLRGIPVEKRGAATQAA